MQKNDARCQMKIMTIMKNLNEQRNEHLKIGNDFHVSNEQSNASIPLLSETRNLEYTETCAMYLNLNLKP